MFLVIILTPSPSLDLTPNRLTMKNDFRESYQNIGQGSMVCLNFEVPTQLNFFRDPVALDLDLLSFQYLCSQAIISYI